MTLGATTRIAQRRRHSGRRARVPTPSSRRATAHTYAARACISDASEGGQPGASVSINRGGIRLGTSELYRRVLTHPDIVDALVVDVPVAAGASRVMLFVVRDQAPIRRLNSLQS